MVTKLDHKGRAKASYPGELIFGDEEQLVVRALWTREAPLDLGLFALEQGDIFVEHYYRAARYNIFAVYSRVGVLKGWYANITAPLDVRPGEIRWQDLALDLLVTPDGRQQVLDEDEFAALGKRLELEMDVAERKKIHKQMVDIIEDECPGAALWMEVVWYGVRKNIQWKPYSFWYMDFGPRNLKFIN
jgi:ABC-type transport system substrate-binding protein